MAMTVTVPALANFSRSMMSLPSCMAPAPVISRWDESGLSSVIEPAGMAMSGTVCMVRVPACRATGARNCTVPPTLVCTEISLSARPLLRISRYATVVPGVVGCGTYALATTIDDAALADAHPVTTSAASKAAPAIGRTDLSLRMVTGYRPEIPPSAAVDSGAKQAERRGTKVQHRLVETLQRESGAPVLPGPFAELEDLQLAPGVPAVGRVEGSPPGLGQRRGPGQVGIRLEPARRVLDRHPGRVHADGARQPGHPHQRLEPDPDRDPRVVGAEPFLHAEFLAVVRPALDERAGLQRAPDLRAQVPQRAAVREVPGRHLVHGDAGQRGVTEHLQPLLLLTFRPGFLRRGDVVPRRAFRLAGRRPRHHRHRPPPGLGRETDQAHAVVVGDQVMVASELDGPLGPQPGRVDHTGAVGVVMVQVAGHVKRGSEPWPGF